jgi:aldehyde dehydrogenase
MATVSKPQLYAKPGTPDSVVTVKPRYDNFIGGRWVPPAGGKYTPNLSPATGESFTQVACSTPEDIEHALDAAHAAKDAWGEASLTERARVLNEQNCRYDGGASGNAGGRRELG